MPFIRRPKKAPILPDLSGSCLISHSYQDASSRDDLIRRLPSSTQPFIFHSISVSPDQFVSNSLIEAILQCDALIYLQRGYSATSFWVAFERDYALRTQKPVYAYDPQSGPLRRDTSSPLQLAAFIWHTHRDNVCITSIIAFMANERFFDAWYDVANMKAGPVVDEILENMQRQLDAGGYFTAFWSANAAQSKWIEHEIDPRPIASMVLLSAFTGSSIAIRARTTCAESNGQKCSRRAMFR